MDTLDECLSTQDYLLLTSMFTAVFDLRRFYSMLDKGLGYGAFHFFLIKKTGIHFIVRETDFESTFSAGRDVHQCAVHANGFDEDAINTNTEDWEKSFGMMRDLTNEITASDICEWLCLSSELLDEVDDKIGKDLHLSEFGGDQCIFAREPTTTLY